MDEEEELLIPESVAIKVFNEATGAQCKTLQETIDYLREHPEARELLKAGPPLTKRKQ